DKGIKMGKTEGNAVFLNETPENMYGIIMSWPDGVIGSGFELCTKIPTAEVERIKKELSASEGNPRDLKMKLALEITKINYGEAKAQKAQDYFIKTVQKKETPEEIENKKVKGSNWNIIELLAEVKLASSKSEARRLVEQGGIKVEGEVIKDINKKIEIGKDGILIQRGKRQFVRVIGN
ncbi:MAG: S4 domain-containing protein, partial [Patescibacteria group bacterium]